MSSTKQSKEKKETPLPSTIELDDAEKISLSYLTERIKVKQGELESLQQAQMRILAKIEKAKGLKDGEIVANYQFDGSSLFLPKTE